MVDSGLSEAMHQVKSPKFISDCASRRYFANAGLKGLCDTVINCTFANRFFRKTMSKNDKNSPATEIPSAVNGEGKTKKKGGCLKLGLGVFVALFLLAAIANRDEESGSSTTSSSSSGSASSSQQVNIPADQCSFCRHCAAGSARF